MNNNRYDNITREVIHNWNTYCFFANSLNTKRPKSIAEQVVANHHIPYNIASEIANSVAISMSIGG